MVSCCNRFGGAEELLAQYRFDHLRNELLYVRERIAEDAHTRAQEELNTAREAWQITEEQAERCQSENYSVSFPVSLRMLRVWKASGEELVAISGKELKTVRALKKQLQGYCGLPRFRQRLLLDGRNMEDDESLDFPTDRDLQLVMLGFVGTSEEQVDDMEAAISEDCVPEVEKCLQLPLDPNAGRFLSNSTRNVEIMQLLLEAEADPNGTATDEHWPPLCQAALQHELETVRCLLKAGACLEKSGLLGTPLCLAALAGDSEVLRFLLEARASIEAQTNAGATPLLLVTEGLRPKVSLNVASILVEAGAIVDSRDQLGRTPLWIASRRGHMKVVCLLLKAGARPSMRDMFGKTPFDAARGRKHVRRLLSNAKWSRAPHVKASSRPLEMVLPKCGALCPDAPGVNDKGDYRLNRPLLGFQFAGVLPASVRMLRVWKASGEELVAISGKELKTVRALKKQLQGYCGLPRFRQRLLLDGRNMEDDESLDFPTDRDLQLVMLGFVGTCDLQAEIRDAISKGRVEEVERLLQLPLDPNAGHLHLLLEAKADPNGNGSEQPPWTPLCQVQCLLTAGACLERTGVLGTPLCLSALVPHSDVMSVLLESRANTEAQTDAGATPLLLATESLHPNASFNAATALVEAGAVVDSPDKSGRTPLWFACGRGHVRVVRLLLHAGARPSMRDSLGKTPFDAAHGRKHVRRLLSNAKWSRAQHVKARSRHWENWASEAEKCVSDMKAAREEADGLLLEHTQGPVKARWLTSEISHQIAEREVARQEKLIREVEKEKAQHEQALAKLERQKREGKKNQNAIHNEKDKGKQVARKIANLTTDLHHLQEQAAAAANQCAALKALAARHLGDAATLEGVEAEIERSYGSKDLLDQEFESDDWSEAASSSEDLQGWANMNASGARSSDSAGSTALAKRSDMAKVIEDIEKKWRKDLSATEQKCADQLMKIDRLEEQAAAAANQCAALQAEAN
ncbi:Ankyrin repeat, PH and SEC7 domain containing protein secG [Symbiodinium microadriaticum]|uniref:Ankyrin repeat, PH and SEC7 domain containing protein secG n=2 Tax=Symbiodinium microadriaticum TaxID=2951 RepID=A0A1Q9D729_SYMMI|nr:Ankyrin repeat, PH and SEC7 domain containing protein secG [Symbiodinium microadriaticum]